MPRPIAAFSSARLLALAAALALTAGRTRAQALPQTPAQAAAVIPAPAQPAAAPAHTPTQTTDQIPPSAPTMPLTAEAIMARVAAHQDQAEAGRRHYVYQQHARIISRKGHSVLCEEITETRITPSATGSSSTLLSLQGRLLHNHQYLVYSNLANANEAANANSSAAAPTSDSSTSIRIDTDTDTDTLDRDLVESLRSDLLGDPDRPSAAPANRAPIHTASADKSSDDASTQRDGIDTRLFPLTSARQSDYAFQLLGREQMNGRSVFHLSFRPRSHPAHKQSDRADDDIPAWKGEAYIDATAFQPVLIRTTLAHNIPFAVRTLLGTSLPGLGFAITYAPQPASLSEDHPDAAWFPATFGTEFRIHLLFFFSREIILSAENHDFEQTHVTSTILGDPKPLALPPSQ